MGEESGGIRVALFFKILVLLQTCTHLNRASTSLGIVALKWKAGTHVQPKSLWAAAQPTVFILSWGSLLRVRNGVDWWKDAALALLKCAELHQKKSSYSVGVNSPGKIQLSATENGKQWKPGKRNSPGQTLTFDAQVLWMFAKQQWNNFLFILLLSQQLTYRKRTTVMEISRKQNWVGCNVNGADYRPGSQPRGGKGKSKRVSRSLSAYSGPF